MEFGSAIKNMSITLSMIEAMHLMWKTKYRFCYETIPKGKLRVGKFVLFKTKCIQQFHHIRCAFRSFRETILKKHCYSIKLDEFQRLTEARHITKNVNLKLNCTLVSYYSLFVSTEDQSHSENVVQYIHLFFLIVTKKSKSV